MTLTDQVITCTNNNVSIDFADKFNIVPTPNPTTPHSCTDDYIPYYYGCYKEVTDATTWEQAEEWCTNDRFDSHLASIHDSAEAAALFTQAIKHRKNLWIGLRDIEVSLS